MVLKPILTLVPGLAIAARTVPAQAGLPATDSAAVVRAAWALAVDGHAPRRSVWLWTPPADDSASGVRLSRGVRAALGRRGVPVSDRRPAGDDTVVVRLTEWRAVRGGVMLQVESAWTTVLGVGPHRCRTSSGNQSRVWVRRGAATWVARWEGPTVHGERACAPIR